MKKFFYDIFMKIAEPRVQRILQFWVYLFLCVVGVGVVTNLPPSFQNILGLLVAYSFGVFMVLGGLLGLVAVLPGIYWLERVSIILLTTAVLIYLVVVITLGATIVSVGVCLAFIFTFIIRWFDIRGMLLAPKKE